MEIKSTSKPISSCIDYKKKLVVLLNYQKQIDTNLSDIYINEFKDVVIFDDVKQFLIENGFSRCKFHKINN